MSLLTPRKEFGPYEYPRCFDFWLKQQQSHWLHTEVEMTSDINDWNFKLSASEKNVVGNTLKGFVATEIFIQEYWSNKVSKWFKKPEIQMMAAAFSATESVHAVSYNHLEASLGIEDHKAFLNEPTAKAKIDRLIENKSTNKEEIAKSLAIFSAFNEGVNLFSSFAVLMSFSQRNLLKGVGKLIEWSAKDENLHSEGGVYLFNCMMKEFPEIMTDEFKRDIYEAARLTIQLEDSFIDNIFSLGNIDGLDPRDLKNYIRFRTNTKLNDLGLKSNWKNIDRTSVDKLAWFNVVSSGITSQDFFAARETNYSANVIDFETIWD